MFFKIMRMGEKKKSLIAVVLSSFLRGRDNWIRTSDPTPPRRIL